MMLLLDAAAKVSVLILLAFAVMTWMRGQSAALRHCVLAWALASAAAVPMLALVAPSWTVPLGPGWTAGGVAGERGVAAAAPASSRPAVSTMQEHALRAMPGAPNGPTSGPGRPAGASLTAALTAVWAAGLVWMLSVLAAGVARLRWLAARSSVITEGPWAEIARQVSKELGVERPVGLLRSPHPTRLVTWGWLRPVVLLPVGSDGWSRERIRIVLTHELAHVLRRDWALQVGAHLMRSMYWFNPLVWLACRRLADEGEHACDDAVVSHGVDGASYAEHLVDLARALRGPSGLWSPAPAIVRPTTLERRVTAMLNPRINRAPVARVRSIGVALALFGIAVPIAGVQALSQSYSKLTGTVVDAQHQPVAGVTLRLSNERTQSKYEIRSDALGRFEFVGLLPGDYALESEAFGFRRYFQRVTVEGVNLRRDIALEVGAVREHVVVRASSDLKELVVTADAGVDAARMVEECTTSANAAGRSGGGHIRPPRKMRHVAPVSPDALGPAGVRGVVQLETRIGTDGSVVSVEPVDATVDPRLLAAASEAVQQWQFEPTLLNCVPVEVEMDVRIEFQ
jgi:TonB family protein